LSIQSLKKRLALAGVGQPPTWHIASVGDEDTMGGIVAMDSEKTHEAWQSSPEMLFEMFLEMLFEMLFEILFEILLEESRVLLRIGIGRHAQRGGEFRLVGGHELPSELDI
jgi:hypothetical protein